MTDDSRTLTAAFRKGLGPAGDAAGDAFDFLGVFLIWIHQGKFAPIASILRYADDRASLSIACLDADAVPDWVEAPTASTDILGVVPVYGLPHIAANVSVSGSETLFCSVCDGAPVRYRGEAAIPCDFDDQDCEPCRSCGLNVCLICRALRGGHEHPEECECFRTWYPFGEHRS